MGGRSYAPIIIAWVGSPERDFSSGTPLVSVCSIFIHLAEVAKQWWHILNDRWHEGNLKMVSLLFMRAESEKGLRIGFHSQFETRGQEEWVLEVQSYC